jgi:hypothetical protein
VIFGKKNVFAIEILPLDVAPMDGWRFANVSFWVDGEPLGDMNEAEALGPFCASLKHFLRFRAARTQSMLFELPADELFNLVHGKLYGNAEDDAKHAWDTYGPYRAVDFDLDCFRRWEGYLVESRNSARFVWAEREPTVRQFHDARIPAGEFDRIVSQAIRAIETDSF